MATHKSNNAAIAVMQQMLQEQLREISHTIDHYAYRLKSGKAVCMDCGHEWQEVGFGIYRCPNCGEMVEIRNAKKHVRRHKSYFNVITTMEDYQVIPMFLMIVEMRKGMKAKPAYLEIGQYWISSPSVGQLKGDPKGHATVVGLQRTLGYYVDSFAFGSPLEIRGDNDAFRHIAWQWVYPRIKSTDAIKRNGFKGCCHAMHPVTLFPQLLPNPKDYDTNDPKRNIDHPSRTGAV